MTDEIQRPPTHSRAWLDALICPMWVDTEKLRAVLPKGHNLSPTTQPGSVRGKHPIILEIWRVRDGHLEVGGIDSHGWSELSGATTGLGVGGGVGTLVGAGVGGLAGAAGGGLLGLWMGPFGWLLGATAGATAGAATGATLTGTAGALVGARWGAGAARRVSEAGSRMAGSYNEIMVTVPCKHVTPRGENEVAFVLAMYTDSALSRWGERILGFGYHKKPARVTQVAADTLEVSTRASEPLLKIKVHDLLQSADSKQPAARPSLPWLALPLLGLAPSGRAVISFLERSFSHDSVRLAAASVRVETTAAFLTGFGASGTRIAPLTTDNPWGAFVATGLPVKLTYPRAAGS
jgi:hypothetical protein